MAVRENPKGNKEIQESVEMKNDLEKNGTKDKRPGFRTRNWHLINLRNQHKIKD